MAPTTSVYIPTSVVLQAMIAQMQADGSPITDFIVGSVTRSLFESFAVVIANQSAVADQLQLDSYLDTATGSALDALGSNWQVSRNPTVQATGQITITRQSTTGSMLLPAGFSQLATTPSVPGQVGVGVLTTQDASFGVGVAAVTVTAQAAQGGGSGNLANFTYLTPLANVNGISAQNGFQVTTAFTGGVDQETDNAYRLRIPITVQGRQSKGTALSYRAAALGVPGVLSAGVLSPGAIRGDGSQVLAGSVEVYYQGSAGLLSAVQTAITNNAAVLNQNNTAYASISLSAPRGQQRIVATVTVYYHPGADPIALATNVSNALQASVNAVGIGNKVYLSQAINAVLAVFGVASVGLPVTTFALFGGGGAADITIPADSYANLAPADTTVVATALPT